MTDVRNERIVWIVSEGSPGHVSQSAGLADALSGFLPIRIERVECRPRLNGVARSLVRAWMGQAGGSLPDWIVRRWLRMDMAAATAAKPDFILSSGGKSVFAARVLAVRHRVPYVFLGERKPYPSSWFHTVFTPSARERDINDVPIEMIPTQVNRSGVERAAAGWTGRPSGRLCAMIIGGASVSHRYTASDWDGLAAGMNLLASREGFRWLITTSRRTGAEAEARLRAGLDKSLLAASVWWAEKTEKKMSAYLGSAEQVFVTQDSVTMVTEAVASARPVIVLRPADVRFPQGSFMPDYLARLEVNRRIVRFTMSGLADFSAQDHIFEVRKEPVEAEIVRQLIPRLGWA